MTDKTVELVPVRRAALEWDGRSGKVRSAPTNYVDRILESAGEWQPTRYPDYAFRPGASVDVLDRFYGSRLVMSETSSAPDVKRYAVQHLTLWLVLLAIGMVWSLLTGVSLASPDFFIDPASGLLGCAGIGITCGALFLAGRSRRA